MAIFDCFQYFNEEHIADLRFNILDEFVNKFVVVESTIDHQGKPKKLHFDINKYKKFKNKINYIIVDDTPTNLIKPHKGGESLVEKHQRNSIVKGLEEANDNDLIILSDVDEIPDLICLKKNLKSPQWLRDLKFKKYPFWRLDKTSNIQIINNGGWHFAYLQTPENISKKIKAFAHGEFNTIDITNEESIKSKIEKGQDIFERGFNLKKIEIDSSFPRFIIQNKDKLKKWII